MALAHRHTHGVHIQNLPAGTVCVGVAPKNLGAKIKLLDGHTAKPKAKAAGGYLSGKIQGRYSMVDVGTGPYRDVLLELVRMEKAGEVLTCDSLHKAAANIGFDGKPNFVFETNCLMVEGNIPQDLLKRVQQGKEKFEKENPTLVKKTKTREVDEEGSEHDDDEKGEAQKPPLKKQKMVDAKNPRMEWHLVEYPSYWKPPFKAFAKTTLTKWDWQYTEQIIAAHNDGALTPTIKKVKTRCLDAMCNEYYLFHGLNANLVNLIVTEGLDERVSNLRGMFGCGIYFAEDSSKSDQYCHAADCKQVGAVYPGAPPAKCTCAAESEKFILVCRVLLGSPHVMLSAASKDNPLRRPPQNPTTKTAFDSVLGESKEHDNKAALNFREYVVFDRRQVYPEFIVRYHRSKKEK